jgi:hypothetical protein
VFFKNIIKKKKTNEIYYLKESREENKESVRIYIQKGFDYCTTSPQYEHNNPSHEGGVQCVGSTLM